MLILTAVVIGVAFQNGLFETTRDAAKRTQVEIDIEELISAVFGTYKSITAENVRNGLGEGWTVVDNNDGTLTCSKGENSFIVNKQTGKIERQGDTSNSQGTETTEGSITIQTSSLFLKTKNETGEITGIEIEGLTGDITWTSSDETVATVTGNNESATVTALATGTTTITATLQEKTATCEVTVNLGWIDNKDGTLTKGTETVTVGSTKYTTTEVKQKLGITNNSGVYNNGEWVVIGAEGEKLKLVSNTNIGGDLVLGKNDSGATSQSTSLKKAIWSYVHAEDSMNTAVRTRTGINSEACRTITLQDICDLLGVDDLNQSTNYGTKYRYYYEDNKVKSKYSTDNEVSWSEPYDTGRSFQTYIDNNGEPAVIDSYGEEIKLTNTYRYYNYSSFTYEQRQKLGSLKTDNYWLYTPFVSCSDTTFSYGMNYMASGDISPFAFVYSNGNSSSNEVGVRAIVYI